VVDDGSGFTDGGSVNGHYGLIGMRERAGEIGGDLRISSSPGKGTTVTVELPVPKNGKNGIRVSTAGVRGGAVSRGES
jgi:nitrate/nitrite-specific signal transduction histidine kinase